MNPNYIIDKSQDYLLQNSTITVYYLPKTVEGVVVTSISQAQADGIEIAYVKRDTADRDSPQYKQKEIVVFHLFRSACPEGFWPNISDRIQALGTFWEVAEAKYTDYDDSLLPQRYRLTCVKTTAPVSP
jgi:hypothetical protein